MNEPHASDHTACVDCSGSISQLPFRTGASYSIAYHEFTPMLVMRVKGTKDGPLVPRLPPLMIARPRRRSRSGSYLERRGGGHFAGLHRNSDNL